MSKMRIQAYFWEMMKRAATAVRDGQLHDDVLNLEWSEFSHQLDLYADYVVKETIREGRTQLIYLRQGRRKNDPPIS